MAASLIRTLVVDDYETWHGFVSSTLRNLPEIQVIGHISDGLEAIRQVQQLRPDLILMDIGLPSLNGIEAARRIREISPMSKILFMSENRSQDIAEEALRTGASGYVVKSDAGSELLPAVRSVLQGKQYLSASIKDHVSNTPGDGHAAAIRHSHEVAFYADDDSMVDGFASFIESALKAGNVIIAVVTETHHADILRRLEAAGLNIPAAIEQGSYFSLDAADALLRLTVNDTVDPVLCAKVVGDLIVVAATGLKGEHRRVAICGEIAPTLLLKGNAGGAIKLEHLWNEITRGYDVYTLCGYLSSAFPDNGNDPTLEGICAEHSAVHGLEY